MTATRIPGITATDFPKGWRDAKHAIEVLMARAGLDGRVHVLVKAGTFDVTIDGDVLFSGPSLDFAIPLLFGELAARAGFKRRVQEDL